MHGVDWSVTYRSTRWTHDWWPDQVLRPRHMEKCRRILHPRNDARNASWANLVPVSHYG